jgi:hypothetical protein
MSSSLAPPFALHLIAQHLVRPVDACSPSNPCGGCQGDCGSDANCGPGLKCFQKPKGDPLDFYVNLAVPGCFGTSDSTTSSKTDWCVLSDDSNGIPAPTPAPPAPPATTHPTGDRIPLKHKSIVDCSRENQCERCQGRMQPQSRLFARPRMLSKQQGTSWR